jgi:hypothetical protein
VISICALSVMCISILRSVDFDPNTNKTVTAIVFSICVVFVIDKLYRGMLMDLLMGKDLTRAFTIEKGMHRSLVDFIRGKDTAPVSPEVIQKAVVKRSESLKYDPKDSASMIHRKKVIGEEMEVLKAELAELMQREMYCPTNSQQAASSSFQPSQAPNGNEDGNGDDDVSNDTVQKF